MRYIDASGIGIDASYRLAAAERGAIRTSYKGEALRNYTRKLSPRTEVGIILENFMPIVPTDIETRSTDN
jgi:hypothetical protein